MIWPHGIRRPVPKAGPPPSLPGTFVHKIPIPQNWTRIAAGRCLLNSFLTFQELELMIYLDCYADFNSLDGKHDILKKKYVGCEITWIFRK